MMMTDAAIVSLDESWRSTLRRVSSWFRPSNSAQRSMESIGITSNDASVMAPFVEDAISNSMNETAADTVDHARKQARVAAVRALLYARDAQLDRAEQFFTESMSLDPDLSPADIPTFWDLPHAAQVAAARGLRNAGRSRDAQLLASEIGYRHLPGRQERAAS
jgi:hypothetical protein